jgi:diguanylate cyclase (GGDEF)-like protein/PAS domain S-box-containing protein
MLRRMSVRQKIWAMVALFVLGLVGLSAVDMASTRETLIREKKLNTRHLVESAHAVVAHFAREEAAGRLSREVAQESALRTLNAMRYQENEYFWVNDLGFPVPRMVMHPTLPELNGTDLDDPQFDCATSIQVGSDGPVVPTDGRRNLFSAFNEVARQGGAGYVTYSWPKPLAGGRATTELYPKLSYVMRFDPWQWVVGSGIYIDDVDQLVRDQTFKNLSFILGIGGLLALAAGGLAASITRPLARSAGALAAMTRGERPMAPLPVERDDEIGTLIDGFNRVQAQLLAKEASLRLSASVFETAGEGIIITDPRGTILSVNPSFTALTGYSANDVIGRNPNLLKSGRQSPEVYAEMWKALARHGYWQGEVWNRRKNGEVYVETLAITAVRDEGGKVAHYVGIFSDITALKEQQKRLEYMAHFDALTQLPNRVLMADRMQIALTQAARSKDLLAVAFLDLDGFKPVNDRLGHDAGDRLLVEIAQRLQRCVRAGDTVARLGGDEFVLLLVGMEHLAEVRTALERVLVVLAEPMPLKGESVSVSASIGVTLYPHDSSDAEVLLRHADQAMYAAKQAGRGRYHFFDLEHDRSAREHGLLVAELSRALEQGEFLLYYQPKVNLRRGRVVGCEALLRWHHPERGLQMPESFLAALEGEELEVELGDWVIDAALAQMSAWQRAGLDLPVSVNATAAQLQSEAFIPKLAAALARHPDLPRFSLEIEVLETTALTDITYTRRLIEECLALGVSFALDDFGTGYSSLAYFKHLPARALKIDKSFVIEMLDRPDDLAIVEGVIALTHAFQREAIAEGVETAEHAAMLLHLGCELAQGFGIARPMPAERIPAWVAAFRPDPAWAGDAAASGGVAFHLRRAESDHRRWVDRLEAVVLDQSGCASKPPPLNPHHCDFGQWLDGPGRDRYGELEHFARIDRLHRRVHGLGEEIIELARSAGAGVAQTRLAELHALRDQLVGELRALQELTVQS